MATAYAAQSDLYDFGLPRGVLVNAGRLASANATLDAVELDEHGFEADAPVTFRGDAGGALPTPLAPHTTYYAAPLSPSLFQVAATAGGAALDLGSGAGFLVIAELPVDAAIDWASRIIDDMLPAHVVPFESGSVPDIIRMTAAELASGKLLHGSGSASATLMAMVDDAQKRLARWAKGVPVRGANNPANLSVSAAIATTDPTGWKTYGGL